MNNKQNGMSIADLEAAKGLLDGFAKGGVGSCNPQTFGIAATCIGIVADMLNLKGSTLSDDEWNNKDAVGIIVAKTFNGNFEVGQNIPALTANYIVALHNLRLKAMKEFSGGEDADKKGEDKPVESNFAHYKTYEAAEEAYEAVEEYMQEHGFTNGRGWVFGAWLFQPYDKELMEEVKRYDEEGK